MKHCFRFGYRCLATLLLWIWSLAFLSASCNAQEPFADIVAKVKPKVVIVEGFKDTNRVSIGSGFIISGNGDVVTNYHVIDSCFSAKIFLINGKEIEVRGIVAKDEKADLVRLALADVDTTFDSLTTCDTVRGGDIILVVGNPLGLWWSVSNGMISHPIRNFSKKGGYFLQHTAPVDSGSSGSPVVNLRREVIGVHTFSIRENIHFAIPASKIKSLQIGELVTLPEERASKDTLWAMSTEGHYYLGNALHSTGKWDEALPHLQEALKHGKGKDDPEMYLKVADGHNRLGQVDLAIEAYKKATSINPDHFWAWFWLGRICDAHQLYQEAAQAYEQAKRIEPEDYGTLHNLTLVYSCLNKPMKMLRLWKDVINTYGDLSEPHHWIGKAYLRLRRLDEAKKALTIALAVASDCWDSSATYIVLADLYETLGHKKEADEAKEKAAALNRPIAMIVEPVRKPIVIQKKAILQNVGQIPIYQTVRRPPKSCPDSASLPLWIGVEEESKGHYEEALQKYRESIEICSVFVAGYKHLVALYSKLGRFQEALGVLNAAQAHRHTLVQLDETTLEPLPDTVKLKYCFEWTYYRIAIIYSILDLRSKCEESLEGVQYSAKQEPCALVNWVDIDDIYSERGLTPQIAPDASFKFCALGIESELENRTEEAIECYKEAIQIYPNFAEAHFLLARAYVSIGHYVGALGELKHLKDNEFLADKLLNLIYPPLGEQSTVR